MISVVIFGSKGLKLSVLATLGCASISLIAGCQGGLNSLPNLSHPSRVPPPPVGAFQAPTSYSNTTGSDSTANSNSQPKSLGQLRSLESGNSTMREFTPRDVVSLEATEAKIDLNRVGATISPASANVPSPPTALDTANSAWRKP